MPPSYPELPEIVGPGAACRTTAAEDRDLSVLNRIAMTIKDAPRYRRGRRHLDLYLEGFARREHWRRSEAPKTRVLRIRPEHVSRLLR